jgi:hypothetical protein
MIGEGFGRTYGPALAEALARVQAQIAHRKRTPKSRARATVRA